MAVDPVKETMTWKFINSRLALLVALLLPALCLAQGPPLPDQTTVVNTQQITVYDSTLPARERNRRITVGVLRSGLLERLDLIAGSNITLTPGTGNTVTISGQAGGGTADGVVTGLTFAGRTGTMTRTQGLTAVTVQLAPSAYDDRIASWARVVSPSGVVPSVRVGSGAAAARVLYTGNGTLSEWVTLDSIGGGLSRSDVTVGNGLEKTDLTGQSFRLDPDFSFSNVVQTFSISDRMIIGDSTGGTYAPAIASFGFLRRYFESEIQDEGVRLGGDDPSTIVNYTGAGVTGTRSGTTITIDVPGTVSSDGTITGNRQHGISAFRVRPVQYLWTFDGSVGGRRLDPLQRR